MSGYDLGKLAMMIAWCEENNCTLQTKGEVGFGRPCVGVLYGQTYVDYDYELGYPVNGGFWTPENAYHKHDCLAVLVHDEDYNSALDELYNWIVWLVGNNFQVEVQPRETYNKDGAGRQLELLMHGLTQAKLVRA